MEGCPKSRYRQILFAIIPIEREIISSTDILIPGPVTVQKGKISEQELILEFVGMI